MTMTHPISSGKLKTGTCPHGLPAGACPICSGMGGGGGISAKRTTKPSGEMSWDECYAVWQQMLRAKDIAQQKNLNLQIAAKQPLNFSARVDNMTQRVANFLDKISTISQKNPVMKVLAKPLGLMAKVAIPVLNAVKNVVVTAQNIINTAKAFIQEKFANISDKLSAIFGEIKNFKEKKFSDHLKDFKKKFKTIFEINEPEKTDDTSQKLKEISERSKT